MKCDSPRWLVGAGSFCRRCLACARASLATSDERRRSIVRRPGCSRCRRALPSRVPRPLPSWRRLSSRCFLPAITTAQRYMLIGATAPPASVAPRLSREKNTFARRSSPALGSCGNNNTPCFPCGTFVVDELSRMFRPAAALVVTPRQNVPSIASSCQSKQSTLVR